MLVSDKLSKAAVQIFKDRGVEVDYQPDLGKDKEKLAAVIGDYDGLAIRSATKVTAKLLGAAGKLKVIGRAGIGVDNVDVPAATQRGIIVMNTPFGNSITTAEHAIAMMFAVARQLPAADASTQAGKWEKNRFMGVEITAKTLGIIGCGNIGSIVAERAIGLKMRVIAFDPFLSDERAMQLGVEKVDLDELFRRADFITLHTPLTEKTKGIIDAAAIAKMKDGVRIINCARGGLVVEEDLAAAIKSGKVAGAGVDVFVTEPAESSPLFGLANVVCTPHLGAATTEAQENVAIQVAEQMSDYLIDGAVSNALNMPSITAEEAPRLMPFVKLAEDLGSFAGQLTETTHPRRDHRICRRRRRHEHQGADVGAARRPAPADPHRGQHGQRADRGARARHRGRRGAPDPARRLRDLHPPDGEDRAAGALGRRHGLLGRQAARHPDQGHQPRRQLRAAHALHHQQGQAGLHRPARHAARLREGQHRHLQSRPRGARRRCHRADRGRRGDERRRARAGR